LRIKCYKDRQDQPSQQLLEVTDSKLILSEKKMMKDILWSLLTGLS